MKDQINLLPPTILRARRRRLYFGRANRLYWLGMLSLLMVGLTYGSVYWALNMQNYQLARHLDSLAGNGRIGPSVQPINELLRAIEGTVDSQLLWTEVVDDVLVSAPAEVTIIGIDLKESAVSGESRGDRLPAAARAGALVITGQTGSRAAVVEYERRLQALPWVARVDAPLQNLAGGASPTFSFTVFR
jgi:hypothetical protein